MKKTVFVAMSGGVDSSVAAYLLKKQNYNIVGVYMKNWSGDEYGIQEDCPYKEDLEIARAVAEHLGIDFITYNFEKEYRKFVIDDFFYQYKHGKTPNPDVLCNKYIKFDAFMNKALAEGADMIATGHYSKTVDGRLFKAKDQNKDQTYFLYQLNSHQLEKTLFPLWKYTKQEVRAIAKEAGLPNADKKDSQGICFVGKIDVKDYLKQKLSTKPGNIVDIDTGQIVGKHEGLWFFTIGQRKGIQIGGTDQPYFVAQKDLTTNTLYVAKGKSNPRLWFKKATLKDIHIINPSYYSQEDLLNKKYFSGQIRYRSQIALCNISLNNKQIEVSFSTPQWAMAPGQSLVLYKGDECLGGNIIDKVYNE